MKKHSEYDERQLRLMLDFLISFEKSLISLDTLIDRLEALLHVLEEVNAEWEEKFLDEITTLEIINAFEIMNRTGEEAKEIEKDKKEMWIKEAVEKLKPLIQNELTE